MMPPTRNLTDGDVKAIVALLKAELVEDLYGEVGRGVWTWIKKVFFGALLAFAIYAAADDIEVRREIPGPPLGR